MLRFFRLLRKKLLRQSRFSQYALYAIGEITLVVAGILIALHRKLRPSYSRYLPVNHTFQDMQSSGNSALLTEAQRQALIDLKADQDFLIIVIEKYMSVILNEMSETEKYLGASPNFFPKIGVEIKKEQMVQGLNHRHIEITKTRLLASTIIYVGSRLKEKSKLDLQLLDHS